MNKWIYTGRAEGFYGFLNFLSFMHNIEEIELVISQRGAKKEYLEVAHVNSVTIAYQKTTREDSYDYALVTLVGEEPAVLGLESKIFEAAEKFDEEKKLEEKIKRDRIREKLSKGYLINE